jgi:hypothetical protein
MQIRFSFQTKYGTYSDALNLPDDHNYTEQELEAMKIARRDKWISHIDSTQVDEPIVEPTQE